MPTAQLSIYTRKKNAHGQWESPRKVREIRGRRTGDLKPPLYIRSLINGEQTPKLLTAQTYPEAKEEAARYAAGLEAKARGLQVPQIEDLDRVTLSAAVLSYLKHKSNKAPKTLAQYRNTLLEFIEGSRIRYLDEVSESPLRRYLKFLIEKGLAAKMKQAAVADRFLEGR